MTVYDDSRYAAATVLRVPTASGDVKPALYSVVPAVRSGMNYRTYLVQEGDRLDLLAHSLYGDPGMWWTIADLNPEIAYPDDITPGTTIRLPVL